MPYAVRTVIASLVFLAVTVLPPPRADRMNLTGAETAPKIAEITTLDKRVRIALEILLAPAISDGQPIPKRSLGQQPLIAMGRFLAWVPRQKMHEPVNRLKN